MIELTRKRLYALVIMAVVLGGLFYVFNPFRTHLVYESRFSDPTDTLPVFVSIEDFVDANVTVEFVNEPGLMCRMEVELYGWQMQYTSPYWQAYKNARDWYYVSLEMQRGTMAMRRARAIHITLGVNHSYSLLLDGENLNVSIVYDHGALLDDNTVDLYCSGTVDFTFTEDVVVQGGLTVGAGGYLKKTHIDVSLPEVLDGRVMVGTHDNLYISGRWALKSVTPYDTTYATPDRKDAPLFNLELPGGDYATGSLRG
ncbi:MAG: hypothetical protein ACTSYX_05625 [Candidatus Thorarchaeota archaeon]